MRVQIVVSVDPVLVVRVKMAHMLVDPGLKKRQLQAMVSGRSAIRAAPTDPNRGARHLRSLLRRITAESAKAEA